MYEWLSRRHYDMDNTLSWSVPMTAVAGSIFTAAQFNTYIRDNLLDQRASPGNRCVAYHNTTQSVTSGNTTALNMNSEDVDTAVMHDTSTNNNRITIPSGGGGTYLVIGSSWASTSGNATAQLHLRKNGTAVRTDSQETVGTDFMDRTMSVSALLVLAAADYVELAGQASNANVSFGSATAALATRLEVIGPMPAT